MIEGILDFGKDGAIVGRLKAPKAVKHYTWLMDVTIPHYNEISQDNTVIPSLDDFMVKVIAPEMMHKDSPRSHGAYFRIMRAMTDITHKDAIERLAVQAKYAQHAEKESDSASKARAVKAYNDTIKASDTSARLDKMETSIDMILQALTK